MKLWTILAATTLFAAIPHADAQTGTGTPAFRVPIGSDGSQSSGPATFAWMQNVGTCSNACGDGTRATSYQCQNVGDYDFGGTGYGAPEADSSCSGDGPKPSSSSTSCTNYSGCTYDWVKPAVNVTRIAKANPEGGTYPVGAIDDCSYAKRVFAPYCKRAGTPAVTMSAGDYAFCKNDTPDYDDVAAGKADALGYDRTTDVTSACVPGARDYGWKTGEWNPDANATCNTTTTDTRTVQCMLKFNGSSQPDSQCAGITRPEATKAGAANYSSCTYAWNAEPYGSYSSACSNSATRTRTVSCRRSNGDTVADSSCSGTKPATSETAPNLVGCGYEWTTPSDWTYASGCSTSTTRTRTTSCRRSDGTTVADSQCSAASKPSTTETGVSNLTSCTYTPRNQGRSACTNNNIEQYWDCTRSDGQTGFPASYCGKTNPENIACTSYTYTAREVGRSTCSNSQQQINWDCTRNDGQTGFPASYCGKTNPETVGCTMPPVYTYTAVNRGETACSNGQKQVYWDCTRNDGQTGFPAANCGKTNPETQSCTMPYTYTAVNRGESACSNGQKQVYWDCTRSDGQTGFAASNCGKTNPETQSCANPVTYSPRNRGESACSGGQKQVYWDCVGSDGSTAAASACGKTNPETQSCAMPVSYSWQAGGWSGYNSSCSDSATRTRAVYCQGSDGSQPGDGACGGGRPASSETTGVYSGCSYTSSRASETACSNSRKTVTFACRRSDGANVANSFCGTADTTSEACQSERSCTWVTGAYCSGRMGSVVKQFGGDGSMPPNIYTVWVAGRQAEAYAKTDPRITCIDEETQMYSGNGEGDSNLNVGDATTGTLIRDPNGFAGFKAAMCQ